MQFFIQVRLFSFLKSVVPEMTLCLGLPLPNSSEKVERTEKLLHWYNDCTSCKMKHNFKYLRTEFDRDQQDQNQPRFVAFLDIYMLPNQL